MESYDYKEAIKIMEKRGYVHTADNHAKNVLFFLKTFDNRKLHLHATITLTTHLVDLDTVGNLDLGITLYCDSIDIKNNKFPEFEKKLLNYLYLCVYGKPIHSVEGDSDNGLYFKTESETDGGWKPIGGAKSGEGKPEKPTVTIEDRKKKFWDEVKGVAKQKGYPKELAVEFYEYWSQLNKSKTAFRREKETFFEIPKRFATWIKNDKKWSKQNFIDQKIDKQEKAITEKKQILKHENLF